MKSRETSWSGISSRYNKTVGKTGSFHHENSLLPKVLELLVANKVKSILDLGCGQGVLERAISPEVEYVGVDISSDLVSQAEKYSKRRDIRYVVADASKPITSITRQFDCAVSVLALQNIENYQGVFQNLGTFVENKGTVILVINHPYYRIPRSSGWDILAGNSKQVRWVSSYLLEKKIPINMNPSLRQRSHKKVVTWSFHVPLSKYIEEFAKYGFAITHMDEVSSPKESVGRFADRENVAREEIPLFMILVAKRLY